MTLLRSLGQRWMRLRASAQREFLRDPNVILFERTAEPVRNSAHGR
ncbi:hypothetical protein U5A82_13345 [Sphingobium sp. CR2-8]|nr:hypothetical protein [Sphingobium sp. CR2-8]MEC3911410.1 hypothetical protein [Sphingobium sp. CR2-8]